MSKKLSIIGFGNQAKAWALNLRDSGYEIFIGLRTNSTSFKNAQELGFQTFDFAAEKLPANDVAILAPDDAHLGIAKDLQGQEATLIFAHGFSLHFDHLSKKYPSFNCLLLAPKAIASEVRMQYETRGNLGALFSAELSKNPAESIVKLKRIAKDLGITSFHPTTVEAETKADLFSEQTLLCSTLPYSALYSFNKLIEKGINPETAYFECWHEVKLIADTMVKLGPVKFFELISPNALAGSEIGRRELFDQAYFEKLERIYQDIDSGEFTKTLSDLDFAELKKEVSAFWKEQPLAQAHERLAKELY